MLKQKIKARIGMSHLTPEGRYQIYTLKSLGQVINAISRTLGRAKSTISEDINLNTGGPCLSIGVRFGEEKLNL
jgi:IS30 family transposase